MEYLSVIVSVPSESEVMISIVGPESKSGPFALRQEFAECELVSVSPTEQYPHGFWKAWEGFAVTIEGRLELETGLHVERVYTFD